jgi:hypothetical protein
MKYVHSTFLKKKWLLQVHGLFRPTLWLLLVPSPSLPCVLFHMVVWQAGSIGLLINGKPMNCISFLFHINYGGDYFPEIIIE